MNKLPPELHVVNGSKGQNQGVELPKSIKARIPKAEWLDNPDAWDKDKFVEETAEFLFKVYGIGNNQDKHTLGFLADQIDIYVESTKMIPRGALVIKQNGGKTMGPNPFLTVKYNALRSIIQLMNELGLTPRSRLSSGVQEDDSPVSKFLRGPKG
jgi:phage terminase small subunit